MLELDSVAPNLSLSFTLRHTFLLDYLTNEGQASAFVGNPPSVSKKQRLGDALQRLKTAPNGILAVSHFDIPASYPAMDKSSSIVVPSIPSSGYIGWLDVPTALAARVFALPDVDPLNVTVEETLQFDAEIEDANYSSRMGSRTSSTSPSCDEQASASSTSADCETGGSPRVVVQLRVPAPAIQALAPVEIQKAAGTPLSVLSSEASRKLSRQLSEDECGTSLVDGTSGAWSRPVFHKALRQSRLSGHHCRNPFWTQPASSSLHEVGHCGVTILYDNLA
jgi:hypothetical protein